LEQAIDARQTGQDGQTAARTGIEYALSAGMAAVRKLDDDGREMERSREESPCRCRRSPSPATSR
jgi:hypothetical protein